jgi:hypothetical protein
MRGRGLEEKRAKELLPILLLDAFGDQKQQILIACMLKGGESLILIVSGPKQWD